MALSYDETLLKRHFKVRICEYLGISALTGKSIKGDDDSVIKEHLLFCNHTPHFEDFSILNSQFLNRESSNQ